MSSKRRDEKDAEERRGRLRPMAALLPGLTKRALGKQGFAAASLITDWEAIVGADLAATTTPVRIAFPRGERTGGALQLRVSGSGAALELQHMETQIVERLNAHLGYAAIARLKLVQSGRRTPRATSGRGTSSPPVVPDVTACPAQDEIDRIGSPGLRDALARMGALVAARESVRKKRD